MSKHEKYYGVSFGFSVAVNVALCIVLGFLLGAWRGAQLGMVFGVVLGIAPLAFRYFADALGKSNSPARTVGNVVFTATVYAIDVLLRLCADAISPLVRSLRWPLLAIRLAVSALVSKTSTLLAALGATIGTPLGLANVGASAIVAINMMGLEFAAPVAFLGLGLLILVLMVTEHETRQAMKNEKGNQQ